MEEDLLDWFPMDLFYDNDGMLSYKKRPVMYEQVFRMNDYSGNLPVDTIFSSLASASSFVPRI